MNTVRDKRQKIEYLNDIVVSGGKCEYRGPLTLFKYRPFDEYTYKMLLSKTLFLCKAKRLDDETECMASIDIHDIYHYQTNSLKSFCIAEILRLLKPYCSEFNFLQIQQLMRRCFTRDGRVNNSYLLDISPGIQELVPDFNVANLVNWLANIPERLDDPKVKPHIEKAILLAVNGRNKVGVCALTENYDDEYMWEKYALDGKGYCVEYDLTNYEYKQEVVPVIYDDDRKTRIVMCIVSSFVGKFIYEMSNHFIKPDASQYSRLFLSKFTKWEYQNEWRIIGKPDADFPAPKVKRIIIGRKASDKNEKEMRDFCKMHNIEVIKAQSC